MPLLDHFHRPLAPGRKWHGFHQAWATAIASGLNRQLPAGYFAEPNVEFNIEIDVATFERTADPARATAAPGATLTTAWSPPAPVQTVPLSIVLDVVEVAVYSEEGGAILAGALELVSPSNKDRQAHRDAFTFKCATYVQQGLGLVVVDVVTARRADLHGELLARLQPPAAEPAGGPQGRNTLYAAAYHPVVQDAEPALDVWYEPLALNQPLPTMPLWLRGGLCVPVELELAYKRTCADLRIGPAGLAS